MHLVTISLQLQFNSYCPFGDDLHRSRATEESTSPVRFCIRAVCQINPAVLGNSFAIALDLEVMTTDFRALRGSAITSGVHCFTIKSLTGTPRNGSSAVG